MRDLLGHSIDNASEHHSVINARVGIAEDLDKLMPKFGPSGIITKNMRDKQTIMDELPSIFYPIKEKCEIMAERHE